MLALGHTTWQWGRRTEKSTGGHTSEEGGEVVLVISSEESFGTGR